MIFYKKNTFFYKIRKSTDPNNIKLSLFFDWLAINKYGIINKKNVKNLVRLINEFQIKSENDFIKNKFIKEIDNDFQKTIKLFSELVDASKSLFKMKYFYQKGYDSSIENDFSSFLEKHFEVQEYLQNKLNKKYSAFSKSLNKYLNLPKSR